MNIFLTGGSGGIGSEIVKILAEDPANKIFFTYFRNTAQAVRLEKECTNAKGIRCDLSKEHDIQGVISQYAKTDFDVIIHNAFVKIEMVDFYKADWRQVEESINAGVKAAFQFTQAFSQSMKKRKAGQIVTILSSCVLDKAPAQMPAYVLAKYALLGLHKIFAAELTKYGIRVNAVSPHMIKTEFLSNLPEHYVNLVEEAAPGKKLATPTDAARLVKFLISDESKHLNNANLTVTQGASA